MPWHTGVSGKKSASGSSEIRGKTLGLIGYGSIGMQLGVIAESLGMQVIFYDVVNKLPLGNARQLPSLNQLLGNCDVISLHVPETGSTQNMIGENELAQMQNGAILINASRGTVVDIDALAASLETGHLGGAGIDVLPEEPPVNGNPRLSRRLPNLIVPPPIAWAAQESRQRALDQIVRNVQAFRNGAPENTLP